MIAGVIDPLSVAELVYSYQIKAAIICTWRTAALVIKFVVVVLHRPTARRLIFDNATECPVIDEPDRDKWCVSTARTGLIPAPGGVRESAQLIVISIN